MVTNMKLAVLLIAVLSHLGCGGGNGLGPTEIKRQEDKLRDRLPTDWSPYNTGNYAAAIDGFTATLEQADILEGSEGVKNQIKSEAQSGIAWSFFKLQDLDKSDLAFRQALQLDSRNVDAWVGRAGVAHALQQFSDSIQFAITALEIDSDYDSGARLDGGGRNLSHDNFDSRHVRLLLAESYFQLGRYSALDRPDPNNASAQLRLIRGQFQFRDPGQLLQNISEEARSLLEESSNSL
jgi:tetratricopeptide (TPR) repeat protein